MPNETKNWTQRTRDRFKASDAVQYVLDVISGKEREPDPQRFAAAQYAINKVLPNPPQTQVNVETDEIPEYFVSGRNDQTG